MKNPPRRLRSPRSAVVQVVVAAPYNFKREQMGAWACNRGSDAILLVMRLAGADDAGLNVSDHVRFVIVSPEPRYSGCLQLEMPAKP